MTYPIPGSPNLIGLDVPACKRLISRTFSPQEVTSLIEEIFASKDEVKAIRDLRGDDAQAFIDVIHGVRSELFFPRAHSDYPSSSTPSLPNPPPSADQALDLPDLQPQLRRICLSVLCRICGFQALLPRSLQIPFCYNRLDTPLYRGGFADVWKGEYQGRHVAVKVLRVYSTSEFVKITRVGSCGLAKIVRREADADYAEVLQRGCNMGGSPPSKCTATSGNHNE